MLFDDLSDVYEAMIDWPKRLANEEPFYRALFERYGVKSVADVACGTGRHAAMFHSWGLRVEGADLSAAMIERARAAFGEPPDLRWAIRSFDRPMDAGTPLDAVVCVGNSLALAPDMATVRRAIGRMLAALRPSGLLIVHVLNLWRLADGPTVWQKCKRAALPQGDALIVKGVHRCGNRGFVDLVVAALDGPPDKPIPVQSDSVAFLGLEAVELDSIARKAGAANAVFYGGYQQQPYDRETSVDLMMVAERGKPGESGEPRA